MKPEHLKLLADKDWRLNNLYWITDKEGKPTRFRMTPEQREYFEGIHTRNIILKARQLGLLTGINHDYDDMLGVVITRRQVPVKYLDALNFPNGNTDADPTKEAVSRYVVEEMTEETFEQVTYTLATPIDCDNAIIPARTILADVCQWQYRGVGCGYDGPAVADERDNPTTNLSKDKCSHRRSGCRFRYPRPEPMPISSFPGSQKVS